MLVEDGLDFLDVLLIADEGVSDELDVLRDRVQDVATVLLGERRQIDAYARDVDALTATELTVVLTGGEELVAFLLLYVEGQSTVVEEDASADGYVVDEVHVVDVDNFVVGLSFGVSLEDDLVTGTEFTLYFCVTFEDGRTDFRTLGIEEDSDAGRDGTRVIDDLGNTFLGHMSRVHTDYVDASFDERTDELYVTAQVRDSSYDLCFLHNALLG